MICSYRNNYCLKRYFVSKVRHQVIASVFQLVKYTFPIWPEHHDLTEILLKVTLNTINLYKPLSLSELSFLSPNE
jgi:hypothetical protein